MATVNDDSRVINKLETSLTGDAIVIIYRHVANRHLANRHLANRYLADIHLADIHLAGRHLADSDQLLLTIKTLFTFLQKQSNLMRRVKPC